MDRWAGRELTEFSPAEMLDFVADCYKIETENQRLVRQALSVLSPTEYGVMLAFDTIYHMAQSVIDHGMIDDTDRDQLKSIQAIARCRRGDLNG